MTMDDNVLALLEVTLWVINQMQTNSNFLRVNFEGVEKQAIELFTAHEREILSSSSEMENRRIHHEV